MKPGCASPPPTGCEAAFSSRELTSPASAYPALSPWESTTRSMSGATWNRALKSASRSGGNLLFLDAATAPRTVSSIAAYDKDGYTCAALNRAGTVVLLSGPPPTAVQQRLPLVNCQVTTTDILNLRANPYGAVIGAVLDAVTLSPLRRTPNWFEVRVEGILGWISADYVTQVGNCAG